MSFCRLNHYTDYLSDSEEALIEPALWMCLVIISFRSTFHMKQTHRTINPYFKVLPTKVKRRLHVIITRYLEQECHCENHVQCDIFPSPLTTERILPSYQHFIQYLHQKNYTIEGGSIPTESGALNRYAETITMIVFGKSEWLLFPTLSNECDGRRGQNFSQHQLYPCRNRFLH